MDFLTRDIAVRLQTAFGDLISDERFATIVDLLVEEVRLTGEDDLVANGM